MFVFRLSIESAHALDARLLSDPAIHAAVAAPTIGAQILAFCSAHGYDFTMGDTDQPEQVTAGDASAPLRGRMLRGGDYPLMAQMLSRGSHAKTSTKIRRAQHRRTRRA